MLNNDTDYDPPPTRDRIDEGSAGFDDNFVDYDCPGHNDSMGSLQPSD